MRPFETPDRPEVGALLRWWRKRRGLSQMTLAHAIGVSPRHMSFVETGRSRPGREVLLRLACTLEVPLRETNVLLESAGYARVFGDSRFEDAELEGLREILVTVLERYEPYSAVVVDAEWRLLMSNRAHRRLSALLLGTEAPVLGDDGANLLEQLFRPGGFRERLVNWPEVAHHMLERLRRQVEENPAREGLRSLLAKLEEGELPPPHDGSPSKLPVLPMHFELSGKHLRLVSMITTFGAPQDVAAQELRLEAFLPADPETEHVLQMLAQNGEA